ncbi:MAG TPA: hypothetical protein VF292_00390 [Rhodanobacteraceae bacterium]
MRDPTLSFDPIPLSFSSAPPVEGGLPFEARPLTRKEERRGDLYLYASPKLQRTIAVIGAMTLAVALDLEFSTATVAYVERPRLLRYRDTEVELSFWDRERTGRERFYLLVSDATSELEPKSRHRQHRDARDLIDAANSAGISLEFVFEADVLAKAASIATWYRLLPYVQTAQSLPHRRSIEGRLLEAFASQRRMTFAQCEAALTGLHPGDVRAVICELIHRGLLWIDPAKPLHRHTVVEARTPA